MSTESLSSNPEEINITEDILQLGDNEVIGDNPVYLNRLQELDSNPETKDWPLLVELNARLSKYSKFSWTSNHFNLKIPPITYNEFSDSYTKNIRKIKQSHKDFFEIDYENLINKDPILVSNLENFIGAKINKDIINT